uniref:Eukaryotic translation initiation factor 4E n=1 Tax=Saccharomyces cerevisiae TaxID=4932 RepID=UPI00002323F1|nr:Chain A, Eukaryotic translation initiation factor 4E [Saccharomyces cerevisiae]
MSVEEVSKKFEENVSVDDTTATPKTVLSDSAHFDVKHPLNTKWTLWYTKPAVDKSESWSDLLRPVTSFQTVEEFWAIIQNIPEPHELPLKSDYHVFRNDVRPEWEDEANAKGGKWSFQLCGKGADIDELWLCTLLAVIGETIDEDDSQINGVVLSIRKGGNKFALWTKCEDKEPLLRIGGKFKQVLKLTDDGHLEFFPHCSANGRHPQPSITL